MMGAEDFNLDDGLLEDGDPGENEEAELWGAHDKILGIENPALHAALIEAGVWFDPLEEQQEDLEEQQEDLEEQQEDLEEQQEDLEEHPEDIKHPRDHDSDKSSRSQSPKIKHWKMDKKSAPLPSVKEYMEGKLQIKDLSGHTYKWILRDISLRDIPLEDLKQIAEDIWLYKKEYSKKSWIKDFLSWLKLVVQKQIEAAQEIKDSKDKADVHYHVNQIMISVYGDISVIISDMEGDLQKIEDTHTSGLPSEYTSDADVLLQSIGEEIATVSITYQIKITALLNKVLWDSASQDEKIQNEIKIKIDELQNTLNNDLFSMYQTLRLSTIYATIKRWFLSQDAKNASELIQMEKKKMSDENEIYREAKNQLEETIKLDQEHTSLDLPI